MLFYMEKGIKAVNGIKVANQLPKLVIVSWITQVGPSIYKCPYKWKREAMESRLIWYENLAFGSFEDGERGLVAKAPSRAQERQGMNPALCLQKRMQPYQPLDFIFLTK